MPHTTSMETNLLPFVPPISTAYVVEEVGIGWLRARRQKPIDWSDQSLLTGKEVISSQSKEGISACFTTSGAAVTPPMQEERMEIIPARSVVTYTTALSPACAIDLKKVLYILVTPYFATAWKDVLATANLSHSFPNLIHYISHGSPIGNPPPFSALSSRTISLLRIFNQTSFGTNCGRKP